VVEKIRKRLARWKGKNLSFARRTCLLKFVVTNLPLIYFLLFKMPAKVEMEVKKIQRVFMKVG